MDMEFIHESSKIRLQQSPKFLDKINIKTIRVRAFISIAAPNSILELYVRKGSSQPLSLMLIYGGKTNPIQGRSMMILFSKPLSKEIEHCLLNKVWLVDPHTINKDTLDST